MEGEGEEGGRGEGREKREGEWIGGRERGGEGEEGGGVDWRERREREWGEEGINNDTDNLLTLAT